MMRSTSDTADSAFAQQVAPCVLLVVAVLRPIARLIHMHTRTTRDKSQCMLTLRYLRALRARFGAHLSGFKRRLQSQHLA
eukprot:7988643-Prorocentrum_lima.AAC.1